MDNKVLFGLVSTVLIIILGLGWEVASLDGRINYLTQKTDGIASTTAQNTQNIAAIINFINSAVKK